MNARPDNITTFDTTAFNGSRNGEFITPYVSEWKGSDKCSYDSTDNRITFDNEYQGIFTLSAVTYTVTYKVINGTWDDSSTADKTETVASEGYPASVPTGMLAATGYEGGSWNTNPSTTTITGNITFTYSFVEKQAVSYTVTFKVVNGSWNDDTTVDKTVTLTGYEGDTLKLTADQIPAVGTKPNANYKTGSWDVTPSTEAAISSNVTYTYTYEADSSGGSSDSGSGNSGSSNNDSDDDDDNNQSSSPQLVHYQEVGIPNGIVRDITGTREATAESNPFQTTIANSSELESLLNISAEQKSQGVNVWLAVTDAGATMPEADKTLIQNAKGNYQVGMLMDVSMFQKVGANETQRITQTNGKVKLSLLIPENLRAAGRSYAIVRVQ